MICVVIPCYNCQDTLRRAVDSIINQKNERWKMILVNDGSTDDTKKICEEYAQKDNRIITVEQNNKGLMNAWKKGVYSSEEEYISFCDSDDYYDNDFIDRIEAVLKDSDYDIIAFGIELDYDDGRKELGFNDYSGAFRKAEINNEILPALFPDKYQGKWAIMQTRVTKVYSHRLLDKIMPDLPDEVSQGEDNLTVFAALLNAESIYILNDYAPYHYVRNDLSMIGRYDSRWYEKLELLNRELLNLAAKYQYGHTNDLRMDHVANTLIYLKKDITRSGKSVKELVEMMKVLRGKREFIESVNKIDLGRLSFKMRLFAGLYINRMYRILIFIVKLSAFMGAGKP